MRALGVVLCLTGSLLPTVGVSLVTVGIGIVLLLLAGDFLRTLQVPRGIGFVILVFGALAIPWLIGDPTALVTEYGAEKMSRLFTLTMASAVAALTLTKRADFTAFARVWLLVALGLSVGALTGASDSVGRATGFLEANPIWLARGIATGAICCAWLVAAKRMRPLIGVALFAALFAGIYATGSRGPMLGAVVGVFIIMLALGKAKGAWLAAVGAWVVYVFVLGSSTFQQSRFGSALDPAGEDESSEARLDMWRATLDLIGNHPLGVGYGNWQREVSGGFAGIYPHNLFLEVFAEAGWLVGAILATATVMVLVKLARRARTDVVATLILALLSAEVLAVMVSGDVNARTFFFLLTAGWVAGSVDRCAATTDAVEREAAPART